MIKRVYIKGFKSLKEVNFELRPLNVLIGQNNGGKTNFLDFFKLLSKSAWGELQKSFVTRGGFDSLLYAGAEDKKIIWNIDFQDIDSPEHDLSYHVELNQKGYQTIVAKEELRKISTGMLREELPLITSYMGRIQLRRMSQRAAIEGALTETEVLPTNDELAIAQISDPFAFPTLYALGEYLKSWEFYTEFPTDLDSPVRKAQPLRTGVRISPTGENLVPVLHNMKERGEYRGVYNEILKTLQKAFPTLHDLHFPPDVAEGKLILRLEDKEFKKEFASSILSDGLLKFLCLAALLLSPDPPKLVCIDEPELGLHPQCISLVAELLLAASERTQLIVTTHSPQLVTGLKEPEHVVTVEKEGGATVFHRLSERKLADWLKEFTLGEIMLMEQTGTHLK